MENTNDIDSGFENTVKGLPHRGAGGEIHKSHVDLPEIVFGLFFVPSFNRISPNSFQIGNGFGTKGKISHG